MQLDKELLPKKYEDDCFIRLSDAMINIQF